MENRHSEESRKADRRDKAMTFANYSIRSQMVRLIAEDAPPKTILRDSAISYAKEQGLDLVQISYDKNARLPVCKLLDYGKYKYEQSKREKNLKKQSRANAVDVKTVQFSITTDDNDRERLISQAKSFLSKGDKVKLTIRFRNRRESANLDYAKNVMKSILNQFNSLAVLDSNPALSGRELACIIRKAG